MELSVALSLRTYAILPDLVVGGLIRYRDQLYGYYRKAYLESDCDLVVRRNHRIPYWGGAMR